MTRDYRENEQLFSQTAVCRVLLEVAAASTDIRGLAEGLFAHAKEIQWPTGKTRKRPA
jgi:hypothetical protein